MSRQSVLCKHDMQHSHSGRYRALSGQGGTRKYANAQATTNNQLSDRQTTYRMSFVAVLRSVALKHRSFPSTSLQVSNPCFHCNKCYNVDIEELSTATSTATHCNNYYARQYPRPLRSPIRICFGPCQPNWRIQEPTLCNNAGV